MAESWFRVAFREMYVCDCCPRFAVYEHDADDETTERLCSPCFNGIWGFRAVELFNSDDS